MEKNRKYWNNWNIGSPPEKMGDLDCQVKRLDTWRNYDKMDEVGTETKLTLISGEWAWE